MDKSTNGSWINSESEVNTQWFKFVTNFYFYAWKSTFDFSVERGEVLYLWCKYFVTIWARDVENWCIGMKMVVLIHICLFGSIWFRGEQQDKLYWLAIIVWITDFDEMGYVHLAAKNLVLAGVKSVTLPDEGIVELWDLSSNLIFFRGWCGEESSTCFCPKTARTENSVAISTSTAELIEEQLSDFQLNAAF